MTAARHLLHLLRGRWFRRLFAVRVASQFADGVFQVALAAYLIFAPERQPSPTAIAAALATVLLPFSVLGPFVGVFLDRWSRRQVLALSNFIRVGMVLLLAGGVNANLHGPVVFGLVIVLIGTAWLLGTASPWLVVPAFVWIIRTRFVVAEERFLEEIFGDAYIEYKKSVRRWI